MDEIKFIGREGELQKLNDLLTRKVASLVVIKGRRRIGKTRLIQEFASNQHYLEFAGLATVEGVTAQTQRDEFARLLNEQTTLPEMKTDDWAKLFALLGQCVQMGRYIILLDEITWMAQDDPTFLSKLKNAWELYFKKNPKLILILCSSISAWVEKNILSSTGYFGRIASKITLKELPLSYCNKMLDMLGFKRSAHEKFMYLLLTGGIPWYIELINASYSAADNIKSLCFDADGILVDEHKYIFHDLFGKRSDIYEKVTRYLADGPAEFNTLTQGIQYAKSGTLTDYLDELIESGYIRRDFSWSLKTRKLSTISQYSLCDNYLRFYYKYIQPNLSLIKENKYKDISLSKLPGFNSILGLQFETLVLNNAGLIHKALHISPEDIVASSAYYQRATKRYPGCQIDYLIQTRHNTLFVCEIKFSQNEIKISVVEEMKNKINRLVIPKNTACMPVLIHVNGVSDGVLDAAYFYSIIDFSECLLAPIASSA